MNLRLAELPLFQHVYLASVEYVDSCVRMCQLCGRFWPLGAVLTPLLHADALASHFGRRSTYQHNSF